MRFGASNSQKRGHLRRRGIESAEWKDGSTQGCGITYPEYDQWAASNGQYLQPSAPAYHRYPLPVVGLGRQAQL
jgi:hypothetical protein